MPSLLLNFAFGCFFASLTLLLPWKKKKNYEQRLLPLQGLFLGFAFFLLLTPRDPLLALFALLVTLVGCVDDIFASTEKGFRGHFSALRKGKLTSGLFKAFSIFLLSLIFAMMTAIPLPFLAAIFLSLSANTFNLLDCFPGRAGKLFLSVSLFPSLFFSLWVAYLPFFVLDLRKRAMLGDGGANLLGFVTAGTLLHLPIPYWAAFTFLLLSLHLYTEKHSLTHFIRAHQWLNWIDNMGVRDK